MNDEGVFAVHRSVFSHPILAGEPYTRVQAWIWLLGNAVWKQTRVRIEGRMVTLERGQLAHSVRFLAVKWKWSKSKVSRFLHELKTETMIDLETGHGSGLITICNYDDYQFGGDGDRDTSGTPSGTQAGHKRDKEEEGNKERIDIVRSTEAPPELFALPAKPKRVSGVDRSFSEFYSAYPRRQSKQDAIKAYAQVRRSGVSHETIMRGLEAAKRSDSRFREQRFTPLPASWLRAGGFEDDTSQSTSHQSLERMLLA